MTERIPFGWPFVVGMLLTDFEPDLSRPIDIVFSEPSWTPAEDIQSRDRLHRGENNS